MPAFKKMARFSFAATESESSESENVYARRTSEICYTSLAERTEGKMAKATEQVLYQHPTTVGNEREEKSVKSLGQRLELGLFRD